MIKAYSLIDWIHWRGGVWNVQRVRVMVSGMGCIKVFTSEVDRAYEYAKRWAKKNSVALDNSE